MTNILKGLILSTFLIGCLGTTLNQHASDLVGVWYEYKMVKLNGDSLSASGKPFPVSMILKFNSNGKGIELSASEKFKYHIEDSFLFLNQNRFYIDHFDKENLIIHDSTQMYEPWNNRYYFRKQ